MHTSSQVYETINRISKQNSHMQKSTKDKSIQNNTVNLTFNQDFNEHLGVTPTRKMSLRYFRDVCERVLPNVPYDFTSIKELNSSKRIKQYYKRTRSLQEYPGLYDLFRKHGFDTSLCNTVRNQNKFVQIGFLGSVGKFLSFVTNKKHQRFSLREGDLEILQNNFGQVCPIKGGFYFPTFDELVVAMNKTASAGLPDPFIKKREVVSELERLYNKLIRGELKPCDVFRYPAAAFLRLQIKSSGLKFRFVQAVECSQQFIESFFMLTIQSRIKHVPFLDTSYCVGRTMYETSQIVSSGKDMFTYGFDYESWDTHRQQEISVCSFALWSSVLMLPFYYQRVFYQCRNLFLTLPVFHPLFESTRRFLGTVSGSGFTSWDNTSCNWISVTLTIYYYCKKHDIVYNPRNYRIYCSGDDVLLHSRHKIDVASYALLMYDRYGMKLKLESESEPGVDYAIFLGSKWTDGEPYREEGHLVASVVFGSGNFPKMSTNELLQSRFFEVFGNVSNCAEYWSRFKRKVIPRRFFFRELSGKHRFDSTRRLEDLIPCNSSKDLRGFWFKTEPSPLAATSNWKNR